MRARRELVVSVARVASVVLAIAVTGAVALGCSGDDAPSGELRDAGPGGCGPANWPEAYCFRVVPGVCCIAPALVEATCAEDGTWNCPDGTIAGGACPGSPYEECGADAGALDDASEPDDSGAADDGGEPSDAGGETDAGGASDAGDPTDAGGDTDAGGESDAGDTTDAGEPDAGETDSGVIDPGLD